MSQDLNLNRITYQSNLRSKPIRENFIDIENNFNALRSEVYASISSTASEVTSARDNFSNLSDNIHIRKVRENDFESYSYCTATSPASMKVRVLAGSGIINGIGVSWNSATSATLSNPSSGQHRLDLVVVNTDNSVSIVAGTPTATSNDPAWPSIATTQEQLAAIYLTAGTSGLIKDANIFNVLPSNDYSDYFIATATTLNQGRYVFNNLVINNNITIDCTSTTGFANLQAKNIIIECLGNYYYNNFSMTTVSPHDIENSCEDGTDGGSLSGGGGGASFVASGGDGGGTYGGAGGQKGFDTNATYRNAINLASGKPGKGGSVTNEQKERKPFILIYGYNITSLGDINLKGVDGVEVGGTSNGGGAGGTLIMIAKKHMRLGGFIKCDGGDGGISNGGGGGGGLVILRYKTITSGAVITVYGGNAGGGGAKAGQNGVIDQASYNDINSDLLNNIFPLNILGIDLE